jgi:splicing factor 1
MTMTLHRITGANNVPLGPSRRFGDNKKKIDLHIIPASSHVSAGDGIKNRNSSRWGPETSQKKGGLLDMPTALESLMTPEQVEAYALQLRIKEITQNLQFNTVIPSRGDRSPSPPPTYDNLGRRTNTREVRYKRQLEHERHNLVSKAMKIIPEFKPPSDYRRLIKTQEKIYIPVNDYPEINFIGQILGPRGKTLKQNEQKSGAKIFIRGKGSVKEGKLPRGPRNSNLEEDLHCLIIADTEEKLTVAVELIQKIIETAASVPEQENELKRSQMRDIAIANGTLRDDEGQPCQKCGELGHRKYNCPQIGMVNSNVVCYRCHQAGHLQKDCKANQRQHGDEADQEYRNFIAEIGGGSISGIGNGQTPLLIESGKPAPWRIQAPQQPQYSSPSTTYGSISFDQIPVPEAPPGVHLGSQQLQSGFPPTLSPPPAASGSMSSFGYTPFPAVPAGLLPNFVPPPPPIPNRFPPPPPGF